jgi:hypothetical protein
MPARAAQAPHHDVMTRRVEGAAHRETDQGGFLCFLCPKTILQSANSGSGTVSKTDSRGSIPPAGAWRLPAFPGRRGSLTSTQRSRHFLTLLSVVPSARRTGVRGPAATPTRGGRTRLSAPVAQRTEQRLSKPRRAGSNPAGGSGTTGHRGRGSWCGRGELGGHVGLPNRSSGLDARRPLVWSAARWSNGRTPGFHPGRHGFDSRTRYDAANDAWHPPGVRPRHALVAQQEQSAPLRTARSRVRVLAGVRAGHRVGTHAHVAPRSRCRVVGVGWL